MKCPNCGCDINDKIVDSLTGGRITTVCDVPIVACLACGTVFALVDDEE